MTVTLVDFTLSIQGECQFFKSARNARFFRGNHAPDVCRINGNELQSGRLVEQVAVRGDSNNYPDASFELVFMISLMIFEDKDHAVISNSQSVFNSYNNAHFQVLLRFLCYLRPCGCLEERSQTTKYRALKKASLSQFRLPTLWGLQTLHQDPTIILYNKSLHRCGKGSQIVSQKVKTYLLFE